MSITTLAEHDGWRVRRLDKGEHCNYEYWIERKVGDEYVPSGSQFTHYDWAKLRYVIESSIAQELEM